MGRTAGIETIARRMLDGSCIKSASFAHCRNIMQDGKSMPHVEFVNINETENGGRHIGNAVAEPITTVDALHQLSPKRPWREMGGRMEFWDGASWLEFQGSAESWLKFIKTL